MNPLTNTHCSGHVPPASVLLATALVSIRNSTGNPVQLRALLDSGSQASFFTSDKARTLMLPTKKTSTTLTPLGAGRTQRVNQLLATKLNESLTYKHININWQLMLICLYYRRLQTTFRQTKSTFHKCAIFKI